MSSRTQVRISPKAHAPGAVADIGDGRPVGCGHLGADDRGQRIAAIAEAHRREHRIGLVEAQIGIGHRADIADVGRHHGVLRHRLFEFAQHLARMHIRRALGDLERPVVLLMRPAVELLLPGVLLRLDLLLALIGIGGGGELAIGEAIGERLGRLLGIADDADRNLLHEAEHAVIAVDLDDLGVLRPVVEPVLGQGAERPEPRAERQHHIGLGDELHRRLRALIAERPAPQADGSPGS